jgi:hypothetical protein
MKLARENAAVVGDVEQEECQKVARVPHSLDAQGGRIEAKPGDQRAFVLEPSWRMESVIRLFVVTGDETPYVADVVALFPTHLQPDNIETH